MPSEIDIGADKEFFIGEDKAIRFRIFEGDVQIDISTWNFEFVLRKKDSDTGTPLIYKNTETEGILFEGDFAAGTQYGVVVIGSSDTDGIKKGDYRYSIKRTDPANETIYPYGKLTLLQATAH